MATPRGAEHRDLEQRLRDLERQVQALTSAALRREQLSVDQGDFVVSGGGNVVVQDGGAVDVLHPNGTLAVRAGDIYWESDGSYAGTGLLIQDDAGQDIAQLRTDNAVGAGRVTLFDKGMRRIFNDDGVSGFGIAVPHLHFPLYATGNIGSGGYVRNTTTSFESMWEGMAQAWSPYLDIEVVCITAAGESGKVRVLVNDVVQQTNDWTGSVFSVLRVDMTQYALGELVRVKIEGRRMAGGATDVAIRPTVMKLDQS